MKPPTVKIHDSDPENSSTVAAAERRKVTRYAFTASASVMEPVSGARLDARTMDLSPAGCYIDTMSPFPVGTALHLRLTRQGKSYESEAAVVTSQPGVGMALIFTTAKPDQHSALDAWVAELSGQSPPREYSLEPGESAGSDRVLKDEQRHVMNELIIVLMRKGFLSEEEGESMLSKLFH